MRKPIEISRKPVTTETGSSLTSATPVLKPEIDPRPPIHIEPIVPKGSEPIFISVFRAHDLLKLDYEFYNCKFEPVDNGKLKGLAHEEGKPAAYLIVRFPPQSIIEQIGISKDLPFQIANRNEALSQSNIKDLTVERITGANQDFITDPTITRISGPSRLVFQIPDDFQTIPLTNEALLEIMRYIPLKVAPSALPPLNYFSKSVSMSDLPKEVVQPGFDETSIEAPFRLILSPNQFATWRHADHEVIKNEQITVVQGSPQVSVDWVELWHTRLATFLPSEENQQTKPINLNWLTSKTEVSEEPQPLKTVRAIWAKDKSFNPEVSKTENTTSSSDDIFSCALTAKDRFNIVHLSSNYYLEDKPFLHPISPIERLDPIFTPFPPSLKNFYYSPQPIKVEQMMLTTLGAWLNLNGQWIPPASIYPELVDAEWDHRSTMGRDHYVKIAINGYLYPFGHKASFVKLTQREFVGNTALLNQKFFLVVKQPEKNFENTGDRYSRQFPFSRVRITTLVTPPINDPNGADPFTPIESSTGKPSYFHVAADDYELNHLEFNVPLIFIGESLASDSDGIAAAQAMYRKLPATNLDGQTLCYAEKSYSDNTLLDTDSINFIASFTESRAPAFYPQIEKALIKIPSVQLLTGDSSPINFKYWEDYLKNGFTQSNPAKIFGDLTENPFPLSFSKCSDRSGGFISPNININWLSSIIGPVGGSNPINSNKFNPASYFDTSGNTDLQPKLFGALDLSRVVAPADGLENVFPTYVYVKQSNKATFVWNANLASTPEIKPKYESIPKPKPPKESILSINGNNDSITGIMTNFYLFMIPDLVFMTLDFSELTFTHKLGRKDEVKIGINSIGFSDVLKFVELLLQLIPIDGFGKQPELTIDTTGVSLNFGLGLPNLALGVFNFSNLSLNAGFNIPFNGKPLNINFGFCKRESPFNVTVSLFGGGGFFGMVVNANGLQMMEAALEFGASVAVDFGVASGGVYVMAGIYFILKRNVDDKFCPSLTGYFRMGGELRVLGLVNVSIELYLALEYDGDTNKVVGRAELTIEVSVLFFSASVQITCERKFAGSNGDPTFEELMGPYTDEVTGNEVRPWDIYCKAFA